MPVKNINVTCALVHILYTLCISCNMGKRADAVQRCCPPKVGLKYVPYIYHLLHALKHVMYEPRLNMIFSQFPCKRHNQTITCLCQVANLNASSARYIYMSRLVEINHRSSLLRDIAQFQVVRAMQLAPPYVSLRSMLVT